MNRSIKFSWLVIAMVFTVLGTSCKDKDGDRFEEEDLAVISTPHGEMYVWLYKETPKHRDNFLKLAAEGFYDSTTFHRIVKDFVVQGGDPLSKDSLPNNDGSGGPGYTVPAEIDTTTSYLRHDFGRLGAARKSDNVNPERASNGSQFYLVSNREGTPFLDGNYTVFGKVISGHTALDSLNVEPTNQFNDRPRDTLYMQVRVEKWRRLHIRETFGFDPEAPD